MYCAEHDYFLCCHHGGGVPWQRHCEQQHAGRPMRLEFYLIQWWTQSLGNSSRGIGGSGLYGGESGGGGGTDGGGGG